MKNFQHIQSAHCENGVTSSLLQNNNLNGITEPLAFGIGSGLFFIQLPFLKVNGGPGELAKKGEVHPLPVFERKNSPFQKLKKLRKILFIFSL